MNKYQPIGIYKQLYSTMKEYIFFMYLKNYKNLHCAKLEN